MSHQNVGEVSNFRKVVKSFEPKKLNIINHPKTSLWPHMVGDSFILQVNLFIIFQRQENLLWTDWNDMLYAPKDDGCCIRMLLVFGRVCRRQIKPIGGKI